MLRKTRTDKKSLNVLKSRVFLGPLTDEGTLSVGKLCHGK